MSRRKLWTFISLTLALINISWAHDEHYQLPRNKRQTSTGSVAGLVNQTTLDVTSVIHQPYLMRKENSDEYEGFIKDILDEISAMIGIQFRIHLSQSGGDLSSDVGWNATDMIEELVRRQDEPTSSGQQADIAAAAIMVTSSRRKKVDFIYPFQDVGLTIVSQKALRDDQTALGFLKSSFHILAPIDIGVWAVFALAVFVVAGLLFLINLRSPYEWRSRHRIGQASEDEADTFNLVGSFWYTLTTMQWQGFDRGPRSVAARVLSAFWFMFVTVIFVTYTAAVASNLFWASTAHADDPRALPFEDLFDLIQNPHYQIGCVANGSTHSYLLQAKGPEFAFLRTRLRPDEDGISGLVRSVDEGLQRLREDKQYAFIMEAAEAKFIVNQKPCDLVTVGNTFAKRSLAWPHRKNLPRQVIDALHIAVMEMTDMGTIEALEKRWFGFGSCWNVTKFEKVMTMSTLVLNKPRKVDMGMFWGPALLLIVGILISILTSFIEGIYYMYKGRYDPKNRPGGRKLALEEETG